MSIFTFIKSRVSIVDVIQEYVTLKKAGLYLKGQCPFHHERTGSFTVSPHREIFYCFGCHKGGDVVAFVAEAERCTPLQAVQHLAERFSIQLPAETSFYKSEGSTDAFKRYTRLCMRVAVWLHQEMLSHNQAVAYLNERGINDRSRSEFAFGYFPEQNLNKLLEFVKKDGFLAQELIAAHILMEGKFGLYSPFAERIILPIKDHLGRIVGFGGRIFRADDTRPKYYNSQDHQFFTKGHILFGLDQAKKAIQESQTVFLVEGYFDCIAMAQAGYQNTVATLGTACTLDHLKVVSRYAQKLYIMYDGDAAGKAAMLKLTHISWALNMELFVIQLPTGEDPASYLLKHTALDALIKEASDIFHFFIRQLGLGYANKPLQERLELVGEFTNIIGLLDDPLKKNFLLQKAAATFDIPISLLAQNAKNIKKIQQPSDAQVYPHTQPTSVEQNIITALINAKNPVGNEDQELLKKNCSSQICKIVEKLLLYNNQQSSFDVSFDVSGFIDNLNQEEKELFAYLVMLGEESHKGDMVELLRILWKKEWKNIASDVKMRLKRAEADHDQPMMMAITKEFGELKNKMRDKGIL